MRMSVVALILALAVPSAGFAGDLAPTENDQLWLHRNLGAAYFANGDHSEAALELQLAREISPTDVADVANAGLAALLAGELELATEAMDQALRLAPESSKLHYARGLISKRTGDLAGAAASLAQARALGAEGPELAYNFGIVAARQKDLDTARREFQSIVEAGPLRAPRHYASSLYRMGRTLLQQGDRATGAAALRDYQALVKAGEGAQLSEEDLEVGPLLELWQIARPADVRAAGPLPAFSTDALPSLPELRWAEIADLDDDGDRDLLVGDGQTVRDLRAENGEWTDVTESRGLAGLLGVTSALALDLDNDGQRDLVRGGGRGLHYHPAVQGSWDPPRTIVAKPIAAFRPVDFDHEGDIDLVAATSLGPVLVRNNGDGSFEDVTGASDLASIGPCVDVAVGDLDDDRDVDLVFVSQRGQVRIASSVRGGKFVVQEPVAGLPGGPFDVAVADFDADGDLDLAVAGPDGVSLVENQGDLRFVARAEVAVEGRVRWPSAGMTTLHPGDFDNDGRIDLLLAQETGGLVALNVGDFSFLASPEPLAALRQAGAIPIAAGLVDADAKLDVISSKSALGFARNVGRMGDALVLSPVGTKNNRNGVGAIFELLAGPAYTRQDGRGYPIHFGLGERREAEAVRVRWPNGIEQAITEEAKPGATVIIEEKAGLVGSCPFLYSWNGRTFEYITDILTVTPLGLPMAPGMFVPPNWDEVIRLRGDQLRPDAEGMLTLQVTEELREVTYLDQAKLYAIDHPADTEVQPNERFKFPPFPEFGIHVIDGARPPITATDTHGRNVAEILSELDDVVVGELPLTRYQGITGRHFIEVDFGDVPPGEKLTLHLAGWLYWTNASINLAIAQDPRHAFIPPSLWVQNAQGEWEDTKIEIGFPGGKTKSIPIDVTGAFPDGRARFRLETTLRIYWDRALLQVGDSPIEPQITELLPDSADLHYRGLSEPILSITGEEPERFDYDVMRASDAPWDQHPGRYTKYGDVTPLVQEPEDMYVIMASGDECTVRWRADRLPPLPDGFVRTYFAAFDGWAKDGDPNTSLATEVGPLPFHGMSGYPYGPDESYPITEEHQAYQAEWNTRPAIRLTRDLAAEAAAHGAPAAQEGTH